MDHTRVLTLGTFVRIVFQRCKYPREIVIFNWLFNITLTESIVVSVVSMLITRMGDQVEHSGLVPVLVVVILLLEIPT
jgi:hypothetical protein